RVETGRPQRLLRLGDVRAGRRTHDRPGRWPPVDGCAGLRRQSLPGRLIDPTMGRQPDPRLVPADRVGGLWAVDAVDQPWVQAERPQRLLHVPHVPATDRTVQDPPRTGRHTGVTDRLLNGHPPLPVAVAGTLPGPDATILVFRTAATTLYERSGECRIPAPTDLNRRL